jgi:hypothetical protein
VRFLSLAAIVCEGENCTTVIIKLFVILGQFGSYLCTTSQARIFITLEARKNPGYRWSRDSQKIDCLRGEGKVSYYMLPLPHFTLRSQGVSVLCRSTLRITYSSKYLIN